MIIPEHKNMPEILVFDLGGTIMEYSGMPHSWVDYYEKAFEFVNREHCLSLSKEDIQESCEILKSKNARVIYREIEYTPGEIFCSVMKHWSVKPNVNAVINSFFKGIELKPVIYDDTVEFLTLFKEKGLKIAALTDLPTAMPDEIFKNDISDLLGYFDLYVSSLVCGFRKPNKNGLLYIADHFGADIKKLIFTGDEEKDIKTAKNAGCVSVLLSREEKDGCKKDYGQDYTVESLDELFALLSSKNL